MNKFDNEAFVHDIVLKKESFKDATIHPLEFLDDALSYYYNKIDEFILSYGDNIKNIYKGIRNNDFPHNKIIAKDVNYVINIYNEYNAGMREFIIKIASSIDGNCSDELSRQEIINKVYKAETNDENFVNMNLKEHEISISDAMLNIECFIDLKAFIRKTKDDIGNLNTLINTLTRNTGTLSNDSTITSLLKLYVKSILEFLSIIISIIVETFNKIMNSVQQRVPIKGFPIESKYTLI